jgi:surfeit locus 1 family protein
MLLGLAGCATLIGLGVWQVQRLQWKTGVLAAIEARMSTTPAPLPANPDPTADRFLPVIVSGRTTGQELDVLVSIPERGAGYRIISGFETDDGRKVMVDLGFVPAEAKGQPRPAGPLTVTGNLLWPDEVDRWTPAPDPSNIWFARDNAAMAGALGTEPILIVARNLSPAPDVMPLPITSTGIPNDHLGYAITWFSLAVVWAIMSGFLMFRTARRKDA